METSLLTDFFQRLLMGGESTAMALTEGLAEASAALLKHSEEVQLGNAELTAMLAAAVGAIKSISGVETLQSRETRLLAELEQVAILGGIAGLLKGSQASLVSVGAVAEAAAGGSVDGFSLAEGRQLSTTQPIMGGSGGGERVTVGGAPEAVADSTGTSASAGSTATPEVAAATRQAVDLCRAVHAAASARTLRLNAEGAHSPMCEALKVLRGAGDTLEKAKIDVSALGEDSRTQLVEAERFRDIKSAELTAAVNAVDAEHKIFDTRREALEAELMKVRDNTKDAASRLALANEERRGFEESNATIRATLEVKVRELSARAAEYDAEGAAVGACGRVLANVSTLRAAALTAAGAAAAVDEAAARSRYVVAVSAHSLGQAGAMRLCLKRLTFCAQELRETRSKQACAAELGLGGDAASDLTRHRFERQYLEAEDGMAAVLAAGDTLKREAESIVPAAVNGVGGNGVTAAAAGDQPGALLSVFADVDTLRAEFEALERPEFTAEAEAKLAAEAEAEAAVAAAMAAKAATEAAEAEAAAAATAESAAREAAETAAETDALSAAGGQETRERDQPGEVAVARTNLGIAVAADVEISSPPTTPRGIDIASPLKALSLRQEAGDVQMQGDAQDEDAPEVPAAGEVQDEDAPEVQATGEVQDKDATETNAAAAAVYSEPPVDETALQADSILNPAAVLEAAAALAAAYESPIPVAAVVVPDPTSSESLPGAEVELLPVPEPEPMLEVEVTPAATVDTVVVGTAEVEPLPVPEPDHEVDVAAPAPVETAGIPDAQIPASISSEEEDGIVEEKETDMGTATEEIEQEEAWPDVSDDEVDHPVFGALSDDAVASTADAKEGGGGDAPAAESSDRDDAPKHTKKKGKGKKGI